MVVVPVKVNVFRSPWDLELVAQACLGVSRFDAFQQTMEISRQVLAQRLKALVADGILARRQYQSRPDRYEYRLTDKGRDLLPIVVAMLKWSEQWRPQAPGPGSTIEQLLRLCGQADS